MFIQCGKFPDNPESFLTIWNSYVHRHRLEDFQTLICAQVFKTNSTNQKENLPSWISWQLITLRIQLSLTIRGLTWPISPSSFSSPSPPSDYHSHRNLLCHHAQQSHLHHHHHHLWFHMLSISSFSTSTFSSCPFSQSSPAPSSSSPSRNPSEAVARDQLEFWSFQTQPMYVFSL